MNWRDLKENGINTLGGLTSGGLDSCTATHWLSENGFAVNCFTVDLGQPDEESLDAVVQRLLSCGADSANIIPGQQPLAEAGLSIIQAQARYEGGYWNTTGIARPVTVRAVLPELEANGINVMFHGATGRGNDQVRFQLASNTLSPEIQIYAPWRDPDFVGRFPGRQQMIDYCQTNRLPIKPSGESRYSTDANFLGLTHEAGDLEDINIPPTFVEPGMGVLAWDAPDSPHIVSIRWDKGVPTAIDGKILPLVDLFKEANRIAGAQGVGIGTHVVENRYVGVKSRGIYEAPGMELLGRTYEYLLQLVLDRRSRVFFENISSVVSRQVYEGYWLDLATTSALTALEPINRLATGTVNVKLYKGGIYFEVAEDVPHSLYTDDSSMEAMGSYDHVDAEGLMKIFGVSAKNVGHRQFPKLGR